MLCFIAFDEVHVQPSLRLRGGHVVGYAYDEPTKLARTVLALMIQPLMGGHAFVARLVPVYKLTASFLKEQVEQLIKLVHECGGNVLMLICDNHIINRQCYQLMRDAMNSSEAHIGKHPCGSEFSLLLIYDPVHLIKNFRNNWISEARQTISVVLHPSGRTVSGAWTDVVQLCKAESSNILRQCWISQAACHPSSLQRQKVSLVLEVINEKTVAALRLEEKDDTADLLDYVVTLWKILSVKYPLTGIHLNDAYRRPISSVCSDSLEFLRGFIRSLTAMKGERISIFLVML